MRPYKRVLLICLLISVVNLLYKVLLRSSPNRQEPNIRQSYGSEALRRNPYLGWQPNWTSSNFTWQACWESSADGSDEPLACRESPAELGSAPPSNQSWIPDETMLRAMLLIGSDGEGRPFPPPLDPTLCGDFSIPGELKGDTNKECLRESMIHTTGHLNSTTVIIQPFNHYGVNSTNRTLPNSTIILPAPTLMCSIYTMSTAHANRIRAIRETWAGGCDGFLAFSTISDPRLPAISIPHEGPEEYNNMWQKVRSIWKFLGTHYLDTYDWFFLAGDDVFLLPHNLKTYLASLAYNDNADPKYKHYYIGRRFNTGTPVHPEGDDYFNTGGAGYVLSQATLRTLLEHIDDEEHCDAKARTSAEDVLMAHCLRYLGIRFTDTRDSKGRERFHHFSPGELFHWQYNPQGWYENYNKDWGILLGKDCCAPDSVSFHYIRKASMMRHMQALLYFCDNQTLAKLDSF